MKLNNLVLFAVFGAMIALPVVASDCEGDFCTIDVVSKPEPLPVHVTDNMKNINVVSIKPVVFDERAPVWDGRHAPYENTGFSKTVNWVDGAPIWDDSVSHYLDKDYSDWFMQPLPTYTPAAADLITRAQVEELLIPFKPKNNLWGGADIVKEIEIVETVVPVETVPTCEILTESQITNYKSHNACPFQTDAECEIWRKKPTFVETVAARGPNLSGFEINTFIATARCNADIRADDVTAAGLLNRYKLLMKSAQACCTDGMVHNLRRAGAKDGLVYKFLADDANFYNIGARCLMMTDAELDADFPNTATANVIADVRNGCLCRGHKWFANMLQPFADIYKMAPEFKNASFEYTYTDGLKRDVTVSVNRDVQNVLNQLDLCP